MGLHFLVLEVLAGMFLEAIALTFWFAQGLDLLMYIGLSCLVVEIFLLQEWRICYNFYGSRKCTLKTKYDRIYKRGRFKASETLLGIETQNATPQPFMLKRFKASETLLGIETSRSIFQKFKIAFASKPLKPF